MDTNKKYLDFVLDEMKGASTMDELLRLEWAEMSLETDIKPSRIGQFIHDTLKG